MNIRLSKETPVHMSRSLGKQSKYLLIRKFCVCFTEAEQKVNHHFLDGSRVKKFYLRKTKKNSKQVKKNQLPVNPPLL